MALSLRFRHFCTKGTINPVDKELREPPDRRPVEQEFVDYWEWWLIEQSS